MAKKNVIVSLLMFLILLISLSCNSLKNGSIRNSYRIIKIDSIAEVYVVHAIYKKQYFKIVSHKVEPKDSDCEMINVGKKYRLSLKTLFLNKEKLPLSINGLDFYGQAINIEEDSIFDIHAANNLKGLCLIKD